VRPGVPRRPGPDRLLGLETTQGTPAGQQHQPAAPQSSGRSLPHLQAARCTPPKTGQTLPTTGNTGWPSTASRSPPITTPLAGKTGEAEPRLIHADCLERRRPELLPAHDPTRAYLRNRAAVRIGRSTRETVQYVSLRSPNVPCLASDRRDESGTRTGDARGSECSHRAAAAVAEPGRWWTLRVPALDR
jgi:hypothetical protein